MPKTLTVLDERSPEEILGQQRVTREKANRYGVSLAESGSLVDPQLDLECDDYAQKYCDIPLTGPSAGISDGVIMKALEKMGMCLEVKISDVASSLNLTLPAMMNRIYTSRVLTSFLDVVMKTRAYLIQEQRDKYLLDALEKAQKGELGKMEFATIKALTSLMDKDMERLNPLQFKAKVVQNSSAKRPRRPEILSKENFVITTTLATEDTDKSEVED